jgi:hypothetical protein
MPDKWLTLAEAAIALKVHPRTVERQIKSGKLQSRRTEGGQLEALISVADEISSASEALAVVAGQAENQVQLALGATSALVKSAQEDARLARTETQRAWSEARIARRGAGAAWATVGVMAAGLMVAVGWTSSALTRSQVELHHSVRQVQEMSDTVEKLSTEREHLRGQIEDANERRARVEGELAARMVADRVAASLATPRSAATTHPAGVMEKIANILVESPSDTPGAQ